MIGLDGDDIQQSTNLTEEYGGQQEKSAWRTFVAWDKLLLAFLVISLLTALAALFFLVTPLLDLVLEFMGLHFAAWNEWKAAIMSGDRGLFIAAILGFVALIFALLARRRMRRDYSLHAEAGCPQCHEDELIRVRRSRRDRSLSYFGLPVRRYSCRNCTWHGLRLAGYSYDHKKEAPQGSEVTLLDEDTSPDLEVYSQESIDAELQTVHDGMASVPKENLAETSSALTETVVNADNDPDSGPVSPADMDQTAAVAELDNHSFPDQGEHIEQTITAVNQNVELPADQQMKDSSSETESESDDQDDDFNRLCFQVAMSKK